MDSIRKASAFLFYLAGIVVILIIILARRGELPEMISPFTHILDLPLIFIAMAYGGSSLYVSLSKRKRSVPLFLTIAIPLTAIFSLLAWFNFSVPFPPVF